MRNAMVGITLMALALVGTTAAAEERIELKRGEARVLSLESLVRLAVGDPETVEVRPLGDSQVEITGGEPGTTKLLTWTRDGEMLEYLVVVTEGAKK